jgi:hypothetical protein
MKTWNFEELRSLCRKRGISDEAISNFSIYANSLNLRYNRAKFHAEQAHNIWNDLIGQSFSFGDKKYNQAEFSYEAYVEACVQSIHAMADILGQIINIVILDGYFSENDSSLKRIAIYMEKNQKAPIVLKDIKKLLYCKEFNYCESFCNIIKHRKLIKSEFRAEYGGDYRNEQGLVFVEFNYKAVTYPKTWAKDIIDKYREEIFNLVVEVGLKINDFVK